jgi:hypothetical protein
MSDAENSVLLVWDIEGGGFSLQVFSARDFRSEFARRGFTVEGEKDGLPKFKGLFGPYDDRAVDGRPLIRYDTWRVHELLST